NAAIQCQNKQDVIDSILALYEQPNFRNALAEKGKAFVQINQGAMTRIYKMLEQFI
ncbi:MAG: hypothetical protein RIQ94_2160, partial [Pseudomonadota bacterium]